MEMILKIIAMGFYGVDHAYLSDGWNRLDFIVVLSSALNYMDLSGGNFTTIRSLRMLRPLRVINAVPGTKPPSPSPSPSLSMQIITAIC